jgi:hypothetical protein
VQCRFSLARKAAGGVRFRFLPQRNEFAEGVRFVWAVSRVICSPALLLVGLRFNNNRGIDYEAERKKRDEREETGKTENARGDSKSHERHNRIVHCTVTECPIPAA